MSPNTANEPDKNLFIKGFETSDDTPLEDLRISKFSFPDQIDVCYFILKLNGDVVDCNDEFKDLFGVKKQDMTPINFFKLIEDQEDANLVMKELQENDSVNNYSIALNTNRSDASKPFLFNCRTIKNKSNTTIGIEGVLKATQINSKLNNEALLKSVIDSTENIIMFVLDRDYKYVNFNTLHKHEMKKVYNVDIVQGKNMLDYIDIEKVRITAKQSYKRVLAGESFSEIQQQPKTHIYYQFFWNPVVDNSDCVVGISCIVQDISHRQLLENKLKLSEERLKSSTELAGIAAWEFNIEANNIYRSSNHDRLYGREKLKKWNLEVYNDLIYEKDREGTIALLRNSILPGGQDEFNVDYRVRWPNGSIHWLSVIGKITARDDNGKAILLQGCTVDITQRKKVEIELEKSNELFAKAFYSSPTPMAIIRLDNISIIDINNSFISLFGYSRENLQGETNLMSKVFDKYLLDQIPLVSKPDGGIRSLHSIAYNSKGSQIEVLVSMERIEFAGTESIIATMIDITKQKRAEDAIRQNEHILRLFIRHSPAAIVMFDKDMKYLAVSDQFVKDFELEEYDLIGMSHYEVFPENSDNWKKIHRRCLSGERLKKEVDQFPRSNGKLDWVKWEIIPWHEKNEEIGGMILFIELITERKEVMDELAKHRKHLEKLVTIRTKEVERQNQELTKKNNELERFNKLFIDREFRIKELRDYVEELQNQIQKK